MDNDVPNDPPPSPPRLNPRVTHDADQLTGHMRMEAGITAAYFKGLCEAGFHRSEALALALEQVRERFRAIYNAKPSKPPPE